MNLKILKNASQLFAPDFDLGTIVSIIYLYEDILVSKETSNDLIFLLNEIRVGANKFIRYVFDGSFLEIKMYLAENNISNEILNELFLFLQTPTNEENLTGNLRLWRSIHKKIYVDRVFGSIWAIANSGKWSQFFSDFFANYLNEVETLYNSFIENTEYQFRQGEFLALYEKLSDESKVYMDYLAENKQVVKDIKNLMQKDYQNGWEENKRVRCLLDYCSEGKEETLKSLYFNISIFSGLSIRAVINQLLYGLFSVGENGTGDGSHQIYLIGIDLHRLFDDLKRDLKVINKNKSMKEVVDDYKQCTNNICEIVKNIVMTGQVKLRSQSSSVQFWPMRDADIANHARANFEGLANNFKNTVFKILNESASDIEEINYKEEYLEKLCKDYYSNVNSDVLKMILQYFRADPLPVGIYDSDMTSYIFSLLKYENRLQCN